MPSGGDSRTSGDLLPRAEHVYTAPSRRHGLGVFAAHGLSRGAIIECCPVLVVASRHVASVERSGLHGYLYDWDGDAGIAFGFGSFYNHSFHPNAEYEAFIDERLVVIRALRAIRAAEEITVNYAGSQVGDALWFTAVE